MTRATGDDVILDLDHSATAVHPAPNPISDEDVSLGKGDLAVQFLADFAQTAPGHFAITGGTGAYRGGIGEVTFVDHPDPQRDDVTFRFTTP